MVQVHGGHLLIHMNMNKTDSTNFIKALAAPEDVHPSALVLHCNSLTANGVVNYELPDSTWVHIRFAFMSCQSMIRIHPHPPVRFKSR